jgi:hypothetical protein
MPGGRGDVAPGGAEGTGGPGGGGGGSGVGLSSPPSVGSSSSSVSSSSSLASSSPRLSTSSSCSVSDSASCSAGSGAGGGIGVTGPAPCGSGIGGGGGGGGGGDTKVPVRGVRAGTGAALVGRFLLGAGPRGRNDELVMGSLEGRDEVWWWLRRGLGDLPASRAVGERFEAAPAAVASVGAMLDDSRTKVSGTAATTIPMYETAATNRATQGVQRQVNTAAICRSIGATAAPGPRVVCTAPRDNQPWCRPTPPGPLTEAALRSTERDQYFVPSGMQGLSLPPARLVPRFD